MDTKRHNIAQWELGRAEPGVENLQKLCKIFEISLDDFISKEIDEQYFNQLEEQVIYYNTKSKSANELILFLKDEIREKNDQIRSLMKQLEKCK